jgi:hypothetical protein
VQLDPALTARLLRVANSAFFGVSRKIETISLAVNLMGIARLHDLVLTTSVIGTFDRNSPWRIWIWGRLLAPQPAYRHHRAHAGRKQQDVFDSERLFVGGLLHGIGDLVMCQVAARRSAPRRSSARAPPVPPLEGSERELHRLRPRRARRRTDARLAVPASDWSPCAPARPSHGAAEEHARECALVHAARAHRGVPWRQIPRATTRSPPATRARSNSPGSMVLPCRTIIAESLRHLADVAEVLLQRQRHAA